MTGSDRNTSVSQGDKTVTYTRDAEDRIISREVKDNGTATSLVKYGFTEADDSDAPAYLLNNSNEVVEKYLTLPGDVLITIRPERTSAGVQTVSLPNLHGDVMATFNADGMLLETHTTGPFGEKLANTATPWNTVEGATYSYVGQHQKTTESDFTIPVTQMGARVYLPTLGRFLSVDPVEGGTDNGYAYTNQPVTEYDTNGKWIWFAIGACVRFCGHIWRGAAAVARAVPKVWKAAKNIKWKGGEIVLNKRTRISPFGNWRAKTDAGKPNWPARAPHWHRKTQPRYKGQRTSPDWHRPWQTWWRKR